MTGRRCLKGMEYLHATLFFAMFLPLIYAVAAWTDPRGTGVLYLKCLLIAVPVIVTERIAARVKSAVLYLLCGALLSAGMGGLIWLVTFSAAQDSAVGLREKCDCAVMIAETVFLVIKRFADRVQAAKWQREEPLAARLVSFLDRPAGGLVWYFMSLYLAGICLNAKTLCDCAFYSAAVYVFLVIFYEYFSAVSAYLEMNRRTKGIPKRRLYRVSFSMLLAFTALLLTGMLPAVLLAGKRQYTDVRKWFADVEPVPFEYMDAPQMPPEPLVKPEWVEILNDSAPPAEPSMLVNAVFFALGTICVLVFLYGVFLLIRQALRDFRDSRDENGDLVEELVDERIQRQREVFLRRKKNGAQSEAERVRRRYRQTIRRHRRERPAPFESPSEIEKYAGLGDDEQMRQLHREYEQVRYGKLQEKL